MALIDHVDWSENYDFDKTLPIASTFIGRVSVGPLGLPVTETKSARLGDNTAAWLSTYHIHQLVVIQKSSCQISAKFHILVAVKNQLTYSYALIEEMNDLTAILKTIKMVPEKDMIFV